MLIFDHREIYLACGHTDMRKSINGLSAIVAGSFKLDPYAPCLFVFCNRARNRIKILEWDGDGFWIYFKRLEKCYLPSDGYAGYHKLPKDIIVVGCWAHASRKFVDECLFGWANRAIK